MSGKNKRARKGVDTAIVVAAITVTGSLLAALLNFDPLKLWWNQRLNPAPAAAFTETFTPFPSAAPAAAASVTASQAPSETAAPFLTDTATATQFLDAGTMIAQLAYNYASGPAPLTVTFNAKTSYVLYPDGTIENCEFKNVCQYSWDVRKDGALIHGPELGGSLFSYTFAKKGNYTVVVYVCRGKICHFASAAITVR